MKFDKTIFLGSSGILYRCARKARQFYGPSLDMEVIETSYTAMKRKYQAEFGDIGRLAGKQSVVEYLRMQKGNVLLFSINNPYILPEDLCNRMDYVMVNLHHALLPAHPGRNAEAWTIYGQDPWGGITWHYMTADVDAGGIIKQEKVKILEHTTSISLLKQCGELAVDSFADFLPFDRIGMSAGTQKMEIKRPERPRRFSEVPNNGMLDLAWDIPKQMAFLNAMNYGAAYTLGKPKVLIRGSICTVGPYRIRHEDKAGLYGRIQDDLDGKVLVREGGRTLEILLERGS